MDLICQVCEKHCVDEERFFKHIHKYHPDYWRVFAGGRPISDFIETKEPRRREKRFSCPICNKKYSHETGYVKHLATHPGSDPGLRLQLYSCPVNQCQKLFTKETYLLRHMEMKLDTLHTAALEEWRKRPPMEQVMLTRPVGLPHSGEPLPPFDAHVLSAAMGPPLHSLASSMGPHPSPQNLTMVSHRDSPVTSVHAPSTGSSAEEAAPPPMPAQHSLAAELPPYRFKMELDHEESHAQTPPSTTEDQDPRDLRAVVVSNTSSPAHSSSSSPAPHANFHRDDPYAHRPLLASLQQFDRCASVPPPNRSFAMSELRQQDYAPKTPIPPPSQDMYSPRPVDPGTPVPPSVIHYDQHSPEETMSRSPEEHTPTETVNHFASESQQQMHVYTAPSPAATRSLEGVLSFPHLIEAAVGSTSSTGSLSVPPPAPGPFLPASLSPSAGLQAYHTLPRTAMAEHEVATALQHLARSYPNYR